MFEGWGADGWVPVDFSPVLRNRRVAAQGRGGALAPGCAAPARERRRRPHGEAVGPRRARDAPRLPAGHTDITQSLAFNPTGQLLVTTSRDRELGVLDLRIGGDPVRVGEGHGGIKGARVVTTGFSRMSDRQVGVWETRSRTSRRSRLTSPRVS